MYRAKALCSSDRPGWRRLIGDIGGTNIRFAWLKQASSTCLALTTLSRSPTFIFIFNLFYKVIRLHAGELCLSEDEFKRAQVIESPLSGLTCEAGRVRLSARGCGVIGFSL
jgi:hypothetical protein